MTSFFLAILTIGGLTQLALLICAIGEVRDAIRENTKARK